MRAQSVAELDRNAQIAFNLRRMRAKKGISQKELAELVGVSQALVAMLESGARTMTVQMCVDIAHALSCDIKDILGE